ncbi:MAG TPA: hypothetical protein VFM37_04095, partial [Pseudonocardiaceae bacterium]|nr:hypothetical protein [Pseudonocardiaceae bacterium]
AARDWYEAEYAAAIATDETSYLTETADPAGDAATTGDGGTVADDLAATTDIGGPPTVHADSASLTTGLGALTADPAMDGSRTETDDMRTETDDMRTETDDTPGALPGYGGLSLASVRGRLRTLDLSGLQELLDYERAHANRPEFVRMLTNRISTVRNR